MNGSKLLVMGVLLGFGVGMAAAIGVKVVRSRAARPPEAGSAVVSGGGGELAAIGVEAAAAGEADGTPGPTESPTPYALGDPEPAPADEPMETMEEASDRERRRATAASRPRSTAGSTRKVAAVRKPAIPAGEDVLDELPVEGPAAQLVFSNAGAGGPAITKVVEERHEDMSIVRVMLTGKARYKILRLPSRNELWIDFEEVDLPGGEKSAPGSNVHVAELRAREFEDVAIARVTVRLANEGKFSVFPAKGTGEADGMLELMLGP